MRKIFLCAIAFWMAVSSSMALEVNSATAQQLTQLKGIGTKTAESILRERQRAGPFTSVEDFSIRIKGMGKKKVEKLLQQGMVVNGQTSLSQVSAQGSTEKTSTYRDTRQQADSRQSAEGKVMYVRPRQQAQ